MARRAIGSQRGAVALFNRAPAAQLTLPLDQRTITFGIPGDYFLARVGWRGLFCEVMRAAASHGQCF